MQLLLRIYFGLKHCQMLQLLVLLSSIVALCRSQPNSDEETGEKNEHCMEAKLKCVISAYNASMGIWYDPEYAKNVCATNGKSCRKFTNQCEFETTDCKGQTWEKVNLQLCNSIKTGANGPCNCPSAAGCSTEKNICARHLFTCQNFRDECEMKLARCRGEKWKVTRSFNCCQFKEDERHTCTLSAGRPTCATMDYKACYAFHDRCSVIGENIKNGHKWHILKEHHCRKIAIGSFGNCE